MSRRVAVIGAGIVGLSAACELRRRGHDVALFDPAGAGRSTSFGNAALIAVAQNLPLAMPKTLAELPRLLTDPESPLVIRPRHLPALTPWGLAFLRASRPEAVAETAAALGGLLGEAMPAWLDLLGHFGETPRLVRRGTLNVYLDPKRLAAAERDAVMQRRFGARLDPIPAEEIRQMEPALTGRFAGALFSPDAGYVADPGALSEALAARLVEVGAAIRRESVRDVEDRGGDGIRVVTESGASTFDDVVIATGVAAGDLARRHGCRVRIESERGYHVEIPEAAEMLRGPVGIGDARFVMTPLAGRLRLAGTAEFGGRDVAPDWRRADILLTQARRLLPELPATTDRRWSGHRPATPDSRPVIGRSPRSPRILFAFGHGHLGLTLAAVTARRIAALVAGSNPPDLAAFRPDR